MPKKYWLIKSEPGEFSIDDLKNSPKQTTCWDGVRNYQARNFIRDEIKSGDLVLFYHSNTDPNAVVGTCVIVKEAYADYTQFDKDNKHFFPSAKPEDPVWYMVDIKFKSKFKKPVSLDEIKANPKLKNMRVAKRGNRLSVMPVEKNEFEEIIKISAK